MEERRQHLRSTVIKGATLSNDLGDSRPCVVMNQSETGAKVQIDALDFIMGSSSIMLKFTGCDLIHNCRCVRLHENIVGLEFMG